MQIKDEEDKREGSGHSSLSPVAAPLAWERCTCFWMLWTLPFRFLGIPVFDKSHLGFGTAWLGPYWGNKQASKNAAGRENVGNVLVWFSRGSKTDGVFCAPPPKKVIRQEGVALHVKSVQILSCCWRILPLLYFELQISFSLKWP